MNSVLINVRLLALGVHQSLELFFICLAPFAVILRQALSDFALSGFLRHEQPAHGAEHMFDK